MTITILSWIATTFSVYGLYLNINKRWTGWIFWILATIFWMWKYYSDDWAAFTLWTIYQVFNIYGLLIWLDDGKVHKS